ncbi:MAG TPA: metallophosphoesterase [Candidatus Udaeobacter sp.]|jgi:Icc-related predicted phosphoesterase|nr:metallophosphoesterase [Candidatus Udaeobacter sp.]
MSIVRIAAIADLHIGKTPSAAVQALLPRVPDLADVLLVCGDVTHHGRVEEAEIAARELKRVRVPVLAVLGNHDFHADQQEGIDAALSNAGIQVLDGETAELFGIGFAGVKGFATGFGLRVLEPWGESIVKQFVHEAVNESLRLESALARLSTPHRIALLHYSPIRETVEGEPPEIHAFLGSSRLEEPLNRYRVTAAFHGHAHHGQPEGRTSTGIPVYNVSLPLLAALRPEQPPLRVIEVDVEAPAAP